MTTPTSAEAAAIGHAWNVYHRIMDAEWHRDGDAIREAFDRLLGSLETYSDVLNDVTHPASAYPELEYDDDAFDRALSMAAQDAAEWADELDRLVPEEAEGERAA